MATAQARLQQGWRIHQAGDLAGAERVYRSVLAESPQDADALVFLGIALFDQRQFEASASSYRQALAIRDPYPVAWNNLGNALRMMGELDEAERCLQHALEQRPGYLSALKNRGTLWVWTGAIERGLHWYQEGLKHDPDNAELHRNLGVIYLLLGDYERGWREYRWRWKMPGCKRPSMQAPVWQGEDLCGKTILLYPEQGRGDAIQFVRTAVIAQRAGARVILQCAPELVALFSSAPGYDRLLAEGSPLAEPVDFQASLLEVVDVHFQQTGELPYLESLFSPGHGYLTVSDPLIEYWRRWLEPHTARRVGINWQGNPEHHADVYRSIPLETFRPLADLPATQLINLQFGHGLPQLDGCDFSESILRLPDHVDTSDGAFTDTAAILRSLDVVVTTDTAIAHLAGAVGTEVILLLGRVPDWRWLRDGESTRWYPRMRLIRQQELGRWDDVMQRVAEILRDCR